MKERLKEILAKQHEILYLLANIIWLENKPTLTHMKFELIQE